MNRAKMGFTLIEIMVTVVIMLILTALSVVVIGNIQASARDNERKQDVETVARGLELRYNKGNTFTQTNGPVVSVAPGSYPGDNEMWEWGWYKSIPNDNIFVGVSEEALIAPSGERLGYICALNGFDQPRCDKAEKPANIEQAFSNGSGGWRDIYQYEEVGQDGKYCNNNGMTTDACVRFNIYWISELDKTINPKFPNIPGLKILTSRHKQ